MKVLFAVGNASLSEDIAKKYLEMFGEKLEYKDVFYFKAILEEVKRDKSYDRIVIAETLEPIRSNIVSEIDNMLFNNIDAITDEAQDSDIIFICAENRTRNDEILGKFYNMGLYNVLIGDERQSSKLCRLIKTPRGKKEAKEYLRGNAGVSDLVYEQETGVKEEELLSICRYFDNLRSSDEYLVAFKNVVGQYDSDDELITIVAALTTKLRYGEDIFNALNSDPRFQKYCAWRGVEPAPQDTNEGKRKGFLHNFIGGIKGVKTVQGKSNEATSNVDPIKSDDNSYGIGAKIAGAAYTALQKDDGSDKLREEAVAKQAEEELERQKQLQKLQEEEQLKIQQEELAKKQLEEQTRLQQEELARKQLEEQTRLQQEELARKQLEEQTRLQQEELARKQLEEQTRLQQEELAKKQQEEQIRLQQEEEERRKQEELAKKQQEENIIKQQEELARKQQEDAILRAQQEAIRRAQLEAEQQAQARAQQEAIIKAQQDALLRAQQEATAKYQQQAEQTKIEQQNNDQEARLLAQQEELRRQQEEAKLLAQQDEFKRQQEELKRQQEELKKQQSLGGYTNIDNQAEEMLAYTGATINASSDYKKVIAVVGTDKVGTTFICNSLGTLLSLKGVKVSILDMTKKRGLFWYYSDDTYSKLDAVGTCMSRLSQGDATPVPIGKSKNLTLYTTIPQGREDNRKSYKHRTVIETAKSNCNLLIIDCDFSTPFEYFDYADEIYVVQDLDLLKCRETVEFLRNAYNKNIEWKKIKLIVNNVVPNCKITAKFIKHDPLTLYEDPNNTFNQRDIEEIKEYMEVSMDPANYAVYLDGMVHGRLNYEKYTSELKKQLEELSKKVYGNVAGGKKDKKFFW